MKTKLLIILFYLSIFIGCQQAGEFSNQLKFLGSMVNQYGGQWNGSALHECYEIEITNSKILNAQTDSLEYYSTLVGRAFIDSLDYKFDCITLKLINKQSIGIASKSNSRSQTFDLNLIKNFKDKNVEEYLTIRKAYYAMINAYQGDIPEAQSWFKDILEEEKNNPFVILANAEMLKVEGNKKESLRLVNSIANQYPSEAQLHKYLSFYFTEDKNYDKALYHARIAYDLESENIEFLSNFIGIHRETMNWDSVYLYTSKIIDIDTSSLNAYYLRAYSAFQIGLTDKGCNDLTKILKHDPDIVLADSISRYCN